MQLLTNMYNEIGIKIRNFNDNILFLSIDADGTPSIILGPKMGIYFNFFLCPGYRRKLNIIDLSFLLLSLDYLFF